MENLKYVTRSNDELWHISKHFSEEKYDSTRTIMSELKSEIQEVKWNPKATDLTNPDISFVLSWWQENHSNDFLPNPSLITPEDLKPVLGKVAILEPVNKGEDFNYRLYGSTIIPGPYKDLTGQNLMNIWTPLRTYFLINYRAVMFRKEPLFSIHKPHFSFDIKRWERLILPFGSKNEVSRILLVNMSK